MIVPSDISQLLFASRAELSAKRSRELLESALRKCEEWEGSGGGTAAVLTKAQILAEIVNEEDTSLLRANLWKRVFRLVDVAWAGRPESELSETYSSLAVDCFQDSLSDIDLATRQKLLRTGRDRIDIALKSEKDNLLKSDLLSRKSSVLRNLSLTDFDPIIRLNRLDESVACASLASRLNRTEASLLELALSEWARARYEETDEKYVGRLRKAEALFVDEQLENNELGCLALARFYRLTFRQLDSCKTFAACMVNTKNMRRLLRDAYIFSEAAIQLWYSNYPQDVSKRYLGQAMGFLETAVAGGYQNARILTSLAYSRAILEGPAAGNTVLSEIYKDKVNLSWDQALVVAAEAKGDEPLEFGFALGINQSAVWSTLGTYSKKFLSDPALTEVLYRTAIRLDGHNPVALTNLARFLVRSGTPDSLIEARRLLQKAQSFADRRFTWWRVVLADLEDTAKLARPELSKKVRDHISDPFKPFVDIKQLRDRFKLIEQLANHQERGYELERLIFELARLTFDTAAPSYKCERGASGGLTQIDGYFEQMPEKYRVECKWQTALADHDDIVLFSKRINAVGVSGLFISMSGFGAAAIAAAREISSSKAILLMDGEETRYVFRCQMNFDALIRAKRLYFDLKSEVYHRVGPSPIAA